MKNETICEIIESVKSDICDHYCKYPERYTEDKSDDIFDEKCKDCPLNRL